MPDICDASHSTVSSGARATGMVLLMCIFLGVAVVGIQPALGQDAAIRGSVVDGESGLPLPAVNVFIDQTSIGSATDQDGKFVIEALPPGSYVVVASMVGFEPGLHPIEIIPGDTLHTANFNLAPVVTALDTLTVLQEHPRLWYRQLGRFQTEFLGASENGRAAAILNAYQLDFSEEDGVFSATAAEPLEIINHSLGYLITYILKTFRSNQSRNTLDIQGSFFFEELAPDNRRQQATWEKNRDQAFRGSLQHLLWSLVRGVWRQQGFRVDVDRLDVDDPSRLNRSRLFITEENPLLEPLTGGYMYLMTLPDFLHVVYENEQSWIDLTRDVAHVHESGYVYAPAHSPGSLVLYGDLSKRRLADLLPRDYGLSLIHSRE